MSDVRTAIYYPMLVSHTGTADILSAEERITLWKRFFKMPKSLQDILTDEQVPEKLLDFKKRLGLDDVLLGLVSLYVRKVFFEEIKLSDVEKEIQSILQKNGQPLDIAKEIVQFIQQDVMTISPRLPVMDSRDSSGKSVQEKLIKLPLLKALAEYPRLNEQLITAEKIRLKTQPDLVRPSLANWIRYYRDELGIGFHDQVTRGKFLFQSENGKKLSGDERERINLILKSLEEELPIDINPEQNSIVFPVRTQPSSVSSAFPVRQTVSGFSRPMPSTTKISPLETQSAPQGIPARPKAPLVSPAKPSFLNSKFGPGKNIAGETLHFSTGHVLPGEKQLQTSPVTAFSQPMTEAPNGIMGTPSINTTGISQGRGVALPRSPYSIRPLRMRDDVNRETENR